MSMDNFDDVTAAQADASEVDLGPLSWVVDTLRETLRSVHAHLEQFSNEVQAASGSHVTTLDTGALRLASQGLHEAVGVLDMVERPAAARVVAAMEAAVQKLLANPELCTPESVALIRQAGASVLDYLVSVLKGQPDQAPGLFPAYRPVAALAELDRIHPADLWPHDWVWLETELPALQKEMLVAAAQVQPQFLEAVLRALRSNGQEGALGLSQLALQLWHEGADVPRRVFWQLFAACMQLVAARGLRLDEYLKRMLSRVVAQYQGFQHGETSVSERLAQDMLYFTGVGVSQIAQPQYAPLAQAVVRRYRLHKTPVAGYEQLRYGVLDGAAQEQLRQQVQAFKETWSDVSAGDVRKLGRLAETAQATAEGMRQLWPQEHAFPDALTAVVQSVQQSGQPPSADLAMEVATALLFLEGAQEDYQPHDAMFASRAQQLAQRLQGALAGDPPAALAEWMQALYMRMSDHQTMHQVVVESRAALAEIEQALDQFFRDPKQGSLAADVLPKLGKMAGTLAVLGFDEAGDAVQTMGRQVEQLMAAASQDGHLDATVSQQTIEHLGNSLGALSFMLDMLGYQPEQARRLFHFDAQSQEFRHKAVEREDAHHQAADQVHDALEATVSLLPSMDADNPESLSEQDVLQQLHAAARQAELADQTGLAEKVRAAAAEVQAAHGDKALIAQAVSSVQPQPARPQVVDDGITDAIIDEADLRDIFLEEAAEVIGNGQQAIQALRQDRGEVSQLTNLRRAFHTLKGSGRMVGLASFGEAAWEMERTLNGWLADAQPASDELLALSQEALQALSQWRDAIASNSRSEWTHHDFKRSAEAMQQHKTYLPIGQGAVVADAAPAVPDTPVAAAASMPPAMPVADHAVQSPQAAPVLPVAAVTPPPAPQAPEVTYADRYAGPATMIQDEGVGQPAIETPDFLLEDMFLSGVSPAQEAAAPVVAEAAQPAAHDVWEGLDLSLDLSDTVSDSPQSHADSAESAPAQAIDRMAVPAMPSPPMAATSPEFRPLVSRLVQDVQATQLLDVEQVNKPVEAMDLDIGDMLPDLPPAVPAPAPVQPLVESSVPAAPPAVVAVPEKTTGVTPAVTTPEALSPRKAAPSVSAGKEEPSQAGTFRPEVDAALAPAVEGALSADTETADSLPVAAACTDAVADVPAEDPQDLWAEIDALDAAAGEVFVEVAPADAARHAAVQHALASIMIDTAPQRAVLEDMVDGLPQEQVKHAGDLRIPIPLFNAYLNEADGWSRQLLQELNEWALENDKPAPEEASHLAHSLAGSSATVGLTGLASLARGVEHAIDHLQNRQALVQETHTLVDAAEAVRQELHQFAAGFLRPVNHTLMVSLAAIVAGVPPSAADGTADPVAEFAAEADALASGPALPDLQAVAQSGQAVQEHGLAVAAPAAPGQPAAPDAAADVQDAIDPELFAIFREEADEMVPQLSATLRQWLARPDNQGARNEMMRLLHTFKGGARLAGAMKLGAMAHEMETAIGELGVAVSSAEQLDPLQGMLDELEQFYRLQREGGIAEAAAAAMPAVQPSPRATGSLPAAGSPSVPKADVVAELARVVHMVDEPDTPRTINLDKLQAIAMPVVTNLVAHQATLQQQVRVRAQLLDRMLGQAGEVMTSRARLEGELGQLRGALTDMDASLSRLRTQLRDMELQAESQMQSRMAHSKESSANFDPLEFDRFTRVQELTRMMAESVNDVASVQRNIQRTVQATEDDLIAQARQTKDLQRDLLQTRMVQFDSLSDRLYRVVRQSAKEVDKQVKLDIVGATIEMDRSVTERIAPVFEHLLRNAVVHGIEHTDQRSRVGKGPVGQIEITLRQEGNDVVISVRDDGAGLNALRIREKAAAQGLIGADARITDEEAAQLIFHSGLSTADQISSLAGRGVGMDVVKSEVNALGGNIDVSSRQHFGTEFRLVLPLTTAVTQVVQLRMGDYHFGVPSHLVETVRRATAKEIQDAYNSHIYRVNDEDVPFYWGGAMLRNTPRSQQLASRRQSVVLLRSAAQRIALHVDEVVGTHEVVVKNLGPQLARMPGLAGITQLPDGRLLFIYNPVALSIVYGEEIRAFGADLADPGVLGEAVEVAVVARESDARPLVLVVDDSITVRRVTERLLRREGYRVALAADGMAALRELGQEKPAVVLSDIEMPQMDGFDLLRNIRADEKLQDLPVVMITSRTADKHRAHAMELGASAYLGKPYPEEELLELVRGYAYSPA